MMSVTRPTAIRCDYGCCRAGWNGRNKVHRGAPWPRQRSQHNAGELALGTETADGLRHHFAWVGCGARGNLLKGLLAPTASSRLQSHQHRAREVAHLA
jgi:hypothetical protein